MSTPKPGRPVRGSRTGRPIMVLLDALGRRWALRILWELSGGPRSFRALREASDDVSPSVLNARLADLRGLGLVEAGDAGYRLTRDGVELSKLLSPLERWADRWAERLAAAQRKQDSRRS